MRRASDYRLQGDKREECFIPQRPLSTLESTAQPALVKRMNEISALRMVTTDYLNFSQLHLPHL